MVREFKENEIFSQLKVPPSMPFFVRVDGKGFHKLLEKIGFKKPFDKRFQKIMVSSVKTVFYTGYDPCLAYIFSDEANILFIETNIFNRRVEKIDSTIAGYISSAFTLNLVKNGIVSICSFDARIIPVKINDVRNYLIWRQMENWRNCINAYAQHALRLKGYSGAKLDEILRGMKSKDLHELIYRELGINLAKIPGWQRRGIILYWKYYIKKGYNPAKKVIEKTLRRKLVEEWCPPLFGSPEGERFLKEILNPPRIE